MRRELAMSCLAIVALVGTTGCRQSEDDRLRLARQRAQAEAVVRETETVKRVTIPADSGRIIYDAPPDLSLDGLIRTRAPIVGLAKPLSPGDPAPKQPPPAH